MMFSSLLTWKHCREDNYKALSYMSNKNFERTCFSSLLSSHTHAMLQMQKHCTGVAALIWPQLCKPRSFISGRGFRWKKFCALRAHFFFFAPPFLKSSLRPCHGLVPDANYKHLESFVKLGTHCEPCSGEMSHINDISRPRVNYYLLLLFIK